MYRSPWFSFRPAANWKVLELRGMAGPKNMTQLVPITPVTIGFMATIPIVDGVTHLLILYGLYGKLVYNFVH